MPGTPMLTPTVHVCPTCSRYLLVFCDDGFCYVWQLSSGLLERRVHTAPRIASPHVPTSLSSLPLSSARDAIAASIPSLTSSQRQLFRDSAQSASVSQVHVLAWEGSVPDFISRLRANACGCFTVCMVRGPPLLFHAWSTICVLSSPLHQPNICSGVAAFVQRSPSGQRTSRRDATHRQQALCQPPTTSQFRC